MNAGFGAANRIRTQKAALRTVAQARAALHTLRAFDGQPVTRKFPGAYDLYYETLAKRITNPDASLGEIAAKLGVTKHVYSSRLRRALSYAQRLQGAA